MTQSPSDYDEDTAIAEPPEPIGLQSVDRFEDVLAIEMNEQYLKSIKSEADAKAAAGLAQAARVTSESTPGSARAAQLAAECESAARAVAARGLRIAATPFAWLDPAVIPRRQWLYGGHFIRRFLSLTVAPGALGKSSLEIVEALIMVTGRPLLGVDPDEQINVWYWNGEDPMDELRRRIAAAAIHHQVPPQEFEGRLFVDTGRESKIVIAEQTSGAAVIARPVVDAVIETIRANHIGLMIVDPFVASHHVVENDNPAIELVASAWAEIADVTGCAIELVHHARKTNGSEVTVDDSRGGSALLAKARSARTLNAMTEDEAKRTGVENRRSLFRVTNGKANLIKPPETSDWRQMVSVPLPNGDGVGVVDRWQWPDAFQDVSAADLRAVQEAIGAGRYRASPQAKDWAGNAVANALGLDVANKAHRAKISALLKAWIKNGVLVVVDGLDDNREQRSFIEVGERADG